MSPELVIDLGRNAVETVFLTASPMMVSGVVIGLIVSIFQAATQIQEQTLSFIPKIVAVLGALILFAPWIMDVMLSFTKQVLTSMLISGAGG
ncbi:MAG TPA: flagellar biosynthesis protein FliQ [Desulfohalobiaceae bacterium]|nr:flagellar biosynthesis protein FliQ [Desulfohalobiaceae bacterium]